MTGFFGVGSNVIVNGEVNSVLPITDRAVQYGDGSFTTMRVCNSKIQLFALHMERLREANQRLRINFEKWSVLEQSVQEQAHEIQNGVIKVIITRGSGGRGYGTMGTGPSTFIVTNHARPTHYDEWQNSGINAGVSAIKLAKQPLLAGLKHLNRLEQVMIRREVEESVFSDLLVCDYDGFIIEASMANVFWYKGNQWHTPKLDESGVAGVMRNFIKSHIKQNFNPVLEVKSTLSDLNDADELFICNCVMGVVSVNQLHLDREVNPVIFFDMCKTQQLREALLLGNN